MKLPEHIFKTVVASTPLVSIDLIVRDEQGRVLLGKRTNRPAQGYWFVPGGRIEKGERMAKAFQRLLEAELKLDASQVNARFLGPYEHFYEDNFAGTEFSTHYVVLAFELQLQTDLGTLPDDQHSEYCWLSESELLCANDVHRYTKWYFQPEKQADQPFV